MKRFLLIASVICLAIPVGAFQIPEDVVTRGVDPITAFLLTTVRRINESWVMADYEFELAKEKAGEMPGEMMESAKEKVTESVKSTVNDAVDKAVNEAADKAAEQ